MKYRIIINGVSFYTTAKQIKSGVGDSIDVNYAVRYAYNSLGKFEGLATTYHHNGRDPLQVQIDRIRT